MKHLTIASLILALALSACSSTPTAPSENQASPAFIDPGPPPPLPSDPPNIYVREISAGEEYSCGSNSSGKLYCWGYNLWGQLGNGTNNDTWIPQAVLLPAGVSIQKVSAGRDSACVIGTDSKTYCWGFNDSGQLGNGSLTFSNNPKEVSMPAGVSFKQIAVGSIHACALSSSGKAYCWGANAHGQLGNGSYTQSLIPVAVAMPAGVSFSRISVKSLYACAVGSDGKAYCWGTGLLGDGTANPSTTPKAVTMPAGVSVKQISVGSYHACALGSDSKAYCWGKVIHKDLVCLAYCSPTLSPTAIPMPAGISFSKISAGTVHFCAVASNGNAYCWGMNLSGNLGDGSYSSSEFPKAVDMPVGVSFTQVAAGRFHSCAVASAGKTYCWGSNSNGQLAVNMLGDSNVPMQTLPY